MDGEFRNAIDALLKEVDHLLWESYAASLSGSFTGLRTRLIFPTDINDKGERVVRVSEQEARFTFVAQLEKSIFLYSPEKPTSFKYTQKGRGQRSAETDVGVYSPDGKPILNCEFKAKGITRLAINLEKIRKDIEKLLKETVDGVWFHTLESVKCRTMTELCSLFSAQIFEVHSKLKNRGDTVQRKTLTFHICALKHQFAIQKTLLFDPANVSEALLKQHFDFKCEIQDGTLKSFSANGWQVIRPRGVGAIIGKWPGDETDEQIEQALRELS